MKKNTSFPWVSHAACIFAVAALAALFVFPARYLDKMAGVISEEGEQARIAIMDGRQASAQVHILNMLREFEKRKESIMLFFHHEDVDEMERALNCARDLVALDESDNLICELNSIMQIAEHMRSVENAKLSDIF